MPAREGRRHSGLKATSVAFQPTTPSGQKGAIELSLGFIVAVVFAVVLLSLAIMWLNNLFPQFGGLTDDLVQQAQSKIQETFQEQSSNFAIWPNRYDLAPGKELKMAAGIKNDDELGQDLRFVINVEPATASNNVCQGGDLDSCPQTRDAMASWLSWDRGSSIIQINRVGYRTISVKVPANAVKGTYIFNVVACKEPITSFSSCTETTLNFGGSVQQLTVTVK